MKSKGNYILAMLIFGSIGLVVRRVEVDSVVLAFYRSLLGSGVMLLTFAVRKERLVLTPVKAQGGLLLFAGTALGINWILLFEAYRRTSITSATLAYYMAPVIFLGLSFLFLRLRFTAVRGMTLFIALLGMTLLLTGGSPQSVGDANLAGIALGLAAAFFYALVIFMNRMLKDLPGRARTLLELLTASGVLFLYLLVSGKIPLLSLPAGDWLLVLLLGVVHTGVAYALYFGAVEKLDAQHVALYSYLDPLAAMVLAGIFLSESITLNQGIGALLILGSSFLFEVLGKKEQRRSE